MRSIVINLSLVLLISSTTYGQDLSSYYSYIFNPININPAYSGNTDNIEGILDSRSQFTGVQGSPKNIMVGINSPVFVNQGAGVKLITDTRGIFEVTKADVLYSHKFMLQEDIYFRLGLSVGVLNRRLNPTNLSNSSALLETGDPTLNDNNYSYSRFVSGFGMLCDWKEIKVGFSAPHIIESATEIDQYMVGSVSYDYEIDQKWAVKPAIIYQNIPVTANVLDVMVTGEWSKKLFVVLGYATNSRLKSGVGFNLRGFGISYLYEKSTGGLSSLSSNTHEIILNVSVKRKPKRFASTKMESDLDSMIDYMTGLLNDESSYGKDFIKSEIHKIYEQLDGILEENTDKNAGKVADKLHKVEEQINTLIERYKLD